jgi:ElaB/YqjD/DUF883 family membrane-anchored ribosome-binding protein
MPFGTSDSQLKIVIDAENRAKAVFKEMEGQFEGVQGKLKKMQPTFKKMALIGTAAFAAVGAGVYKMTQDATDAQEVFNKFDVVFQDVSTEADKVAQELRNNFGLAESSAKELLSSTGDMLTGFGLSGSAALSLAEDTNKLAVDLASFTNIEGGAERASKALTKALLGERESVKELGIAILEEDVKAKVQAMEATGKFTNETERQRKAMATLEIAISQSKNAIGDFERTQDSLANKQRVLSERTKEMSESIGSIFIPILQALVNRIEPVISKIADWAERNPGWIKAIVGITLAISGLVAVVGLLGLALPTIIQGFILLKTASVFLTTAVKGVIASFWTLHSVPIIALIAGVITLVILAVKRFKEWVNIVGNFNDAVIMAFWHFKIKALEAIQAVLKWFAKIPVVSDLVKGSIEGVGRAIRETQADFDALAVDGMRRTKKEGEELTDEIDKMTESIIEDLGDLGGAGDEFGQAMTEAFNKAVSAVKEIRDEIKGVQDDIAKANEDYLEKEEDERESYHQKVVEMVTNAEEEIKDLEEERIIALAEGDIKKTQSLEREISKQREIIKTYHDSELDLDHRIAEEKERLAMNEMERLKFDHQKKLLMMQKEHLEGQILRMQKLIEIEKEHKKALEYIGEEKREALEADIAKGKSFREMLAEKTEELGNWFTDSLQGYQGFVSNINNAISQIRPPTPVFGPVYGGPISSAPSSGGGGGGGGWAEGGIVTKPTIGLVGEAGPEAIIPLKKAGVMGGITVNITGNTFMSDDEAAEAIGDRIVNILKTQNRFIY